MAASSLWLVLGFCTIVTVQVFATNTEGCDCQDPYCACANEGFKILGLNGWVILIGAILLAVFIIAFTIFFFVVERRKREHLVVDEDVLTTYSAPPPQTGFESFRLKYKELTFRLGRQIGLLSAEYPYFVIILTLVIIYFLTYRIKDIQISVDPVEIWSPQNSEAFKQKKYFTKNFNQLPRPTRVVLSYHGKSIQTSSGVNDLSYILSHNTLTQVLALQNQIESIKILDNTDNEYVTLADVCFTPLGPENKKCLVRSVLNYWQNNQERLDLETTDKDGTNFDYKDHFQACVNDPSLVNDEIPLNQSCRGPLGNSVRPDEVLGGFTDSNYDDATALFIYIPLKDYSKDDPRLTKTLLWEKAFLNFIGNYTIDNLNISYSAKRSVADEQFKADKSSTTLTILVAYSAMFVYMAFALGQDHASKIITIKARIVIALSGIIIMLLSVVSAIGVGSSWGYVVSPIAIQLVPFLTLAVGGSNIFIIFQKFSKLRPLKDQTLGQGDYLANIMGLSAPSIMAATLSQAIAFYLASLIADSPAIKTVAICASLSVVFNFLLQMTLLVSMLEVEYQHRAQIEKLFSCLEKKFDEEVGQDDTPPTDEQPVTSGKIYDFFSEFYAPLLTSPGGRYIVILVTAISCYISLSVMSSIQVGLVEQNAVPKDSYLQKFYADLNAFSRIGPEVYFVVKSGYNYSTAEGQNKICSEHQCQLNSLTAQLKNASEHPASSRIAQPATSWLDDYLEWIKPHGEPVCCLRYNTSAGGFCAPDVKNASCVPCLSTDKSSSSRSPPSKMNEYVSQFLSQNPSVACSKGGKLLSDSVSLHPGGSIGATYFSTYYTTLMDPGDYIDAYFKANSISKLIEDVLNTFTKPTRQNEVFPYSDFFVYYSQYDNLVVRSIKSLSGTFCVMFLTKGILLGLSFTVAPLITGAIVLFTINLFGLLFFLGIAFSEMALVNVVICIGIAGELFTHIADNFSSHVPSEATTRLIRTRESVSNTGSTLFLGDVLPKFLSCIGLIFLRSNIVQSYFFKVYLGMIGLLVYYGLVFLPVLMSFIGPVVQPTPTEVELTKFAPLERPDEDSELTPIVPGSSASGAATADVNN